MKSSFVCPSCGQNLHAERDAELLIIWCDNLDCPAGTASNNGAAGQDEDEAFDQLCANMKDAEGEQ